MSQQGHVYTVKSDGGSHFTGALVTDAGELESIVAGGALGASVRSRLIHAVIRSTENLAWELLFFATSAGNSGTAALNRYLGRVTFAAADGVRVGGAGLYLYSKPVDVPYVDLDAAVAPQTGFGTNRIHVMLVNRSVASKSAAGAGLLEVELLVEPTAQV